MKTYYLLITAKRSCFLLFLILFGNSVYAQKAKTMHAAFVGTKWSPSAMIGGGMESTQVVMYFRPDGTYTTSLGKGWQTDVDGHYTIVEGAIKLTDSRNESWSISYNGGGSFWHNGTSVLIKKPANKIPPGYYSFSVSTGSGGIGSGTSAPYVGSRSHKGLQFYEDGTFSSDRSSSTYIAGDNVSGYGKRKGENGGTYTIKDGLLTLNFSNGEKSENSCFTSDATSSIVVNGTTYYAEKDDGKPSKTETNLAGKTKASSTDIRSGQAFLKKANLANGGKYLDNVQTLKMESSLGNGAIQITSLVDLAQRRIRNEYRRNGKSIGVEQIEGDRGWEFANGKLAEQSAQTVKEVQTLFYYGIFGLQSARLNNTTILAAPQTTNNQTTIFVFADGNGEAWVFDSGNRLKQQAGKINNRTITHTFSDFKEVQNVVFPFTIIQERNNKSFTYKCSSIVVNPSLSASDWAKP